MPRHRELSATPIPTTACRNCGTRHASYIWSRRCKNIASGERPHATMHAQASSLSDQDIADIAAYLQGAEPAKPSAAVTGKAPKQVAACVACHGENGLGVEAPLTPKPPVLARTTCRLPGAGAAAYRNGRRKNVVMDGMAQLLDQRGRQMIAADYFAKQTSPLTTAQPPKQVVRAGARRLDAGQLLSSSGTARTSDSKRRGSVSCESRGLRRPPANTRRRRPWRAPD